MNETFGNLGEEVLSLCDALLKERALRTRADVVDYILGWAYPLLDPSTDTVCGPMTTEGKLTTLRAKVVAERLQAILVASDEEWSRADHPPAIPDQTADHSTDHRPILADQQANRGVRLMVAVPDQTDDKLPAERRALELLAEGRSNRDVLAALKAEGLKLDRNKLKGLRAKVTTTESRS